MPWLDLDRENAASERAGKLRGVYLAVVTANADQGNDSKYRVKVKFPWLPMDGQDESFWARIVVPMAGAKRGTYFLPEVDDQVLVIFEHGDIGRPLIIGGVWSEKQKPPEKNDNGKNNVRVIKSKTGHRLIFDDTDGSERVILVDSTNQNKILLDNANKVLTIETADGDIEIKASAGAVRFHGKKLLLTSAQKLTGTGGVKLQLATSGAFGAKASQDLILKGGLTQINMGGGSAGGGGTAKGIAGKAIKAGEQVVEQARGGGGGGGGSAGGSPAARERAAQEAASDLADEPASAVAGSGPSGEVRPGEPVQASAVADNVDEVTFEMVDPDTGEVIDTQVAPVKDGRATATMDGSKLAGKPKVNRVVIRSTAGDKVSESAPSPVAGRQEPQGASPSSELVNPQAPAPVRRGEAVAGGGAAGAAGAVGGARVGAAATGDVGGALGGTAGSVVSGDVGGVAGAEAGAVASGDVGGVAGAEAGAVASGDAGATAGAVGGAQAEAAADGDVGGAVGGGAAGAVADGDAAGAAEAAGGAQAGAAASGDAGGAVGGGAAGAAVEGDAAGAAGQAAPGAAAAGGRASAAADGDVAGAAGAPGAAARADAAAEGDVAGAAGVETVDHRGGAAGAAGAAAGGDVGAAAGGGGIDPDLVEAGEKAADGDVAGATGAVAGDQAGAAAGGDAAGAAGGGTAGAAVSGDAAGVAGGVGGAEAGAAASGDARGAAGLGAGATGAKGVASTALDADSADDFAGDVGSDAEGQLKDQTGVADAEVAADRAQNTASRVEGQADHQAAQTAGTPDAYAGGAQHEASSAQYEAQGQVTTDMDQPREVAEERATLEDQQRDAADVAREPEAQANVQKQQIEHQTADARDPEHAAERTSRESMDQAKQDSIREERATIESPADQATDQATGGQRVASHRADGADSAAKDPDRVVKSEVKKKLDD